MTPEQSFREKVIEAKKFQQMGSLANQIYAFLPDLDPHIYLAFEEVDRAMFAGWFFDLGLKNGWSMNDMLTLVYYVGASLPISNDATTSHPLLIAQMHAHALPADSGELSAKSVVEIGSGCGYGLALLSAEGWGYVFGFEIDSKLTEFSKNATTRQGYHPFVEKGDGFYGLFKIAKKYPVDSVIVSAAFPRNWGSHLIDLLQIGGKLVIPEMIERPIDGIAQTRIQVYTKYENRFEQYELGQIWPFVVGQTR